MDPTYYTNGLYHKGIGYYFVTYPSTKQYLLWQTVAVTNSDLETIQLSYSLCYRYVLLVIYDRINPNKIYDMYNSIALSYEKRITAIVNVKLFVYLVEYYFILF